MVVRRHQERVRGSDERVDPTLGDVCRVIERHAELLTEFYDGDERMAVHDLRKHVAWYLKGFPVGGSTRRAFMECENLEDVRREIGRLDPNIRFPERIADKPRGRVRLRQKGASALRMVGIPGNHARGA